MSLALATRSVGADMFNRPGHIFPLRAREGGVLVRGGHTVSYSYGCCIVM